MKTTKKREESEFITVGEAARILGLSEKSIYNGHGGTGHLLRVRMGDAVRLLRKEVEDYKQERIDEARTRQRLIQGLDVS